MARTRVSRGGGHGRGSYKRGRGDRGEPLQMIYRGSGSSQRVPAHVESAPVLTGNMSEMFDQAKAKKIFRFLEKDFRDLFNGECGFWFKERRVVYVHGEEISIHYDQRRITITQLTSLTRTNPIL